MRCQDGEKSRILGAIEDKLAGKHIVSPEPVEVVTGAEIIDLTDAPRASPGQDFPARKADVQSLFRRSVASRLRVTRSGLNTHRTGPSRPSGVCCSW